MTTSADSKTVRKTRSDDVQWCLDEVISRIKQIDYWSKDNTDCLKADKGTHQLARPKRSAHSPSVKEAQYKRIGTLVRNKLYSSKAKKQANLSSLNYFYNSLNTIKQEVRLTVARHNPSLPSIVDDWCVKYPQYSKIIRPLVEDTTKYVNKVRVSVYNQLVSLNKLDADELASELKTLHKKGELEHPIIKFLNLTPAEDTRRKNEISKNLNSRKSDKQTYTLGFISRVTKECLSSSDFNSLVIGVALATGRRAVEVIHQGTFKAVNSHCILFGGQAKKGRGVVVKPYEIPTLIDTGLIVDAVNRLRNTDKYKDLEKELKSIKPEKRNKAINTACSRMLNYTAKRVLDPKTKPKDSLVKFKDSRVIAVQAAILKIMPQPEYKKLDVNVFLERFNGHDGFKEFENYQHVAVTDEQEPEPEEAKPISVSVNALEQADQAINDTGKKVLGKLHTNVKALAERTGLELTQAFIYKGRMIDGTLQKAGGSLALIKQYLAIPEVAEAIETYNKGKS